MVCCRLTGYTFKIVLNGTLDEARKIFAKSVLMALAELEEALLSLPLDSRRFVSFM